MKGVVLDPASNEALMNAKGKTIVVTNGKTLLGGDDKAGVAEIMTALEYMVKTPELSMEISHFHLLQMRRLELA